MKDEFYRRVYEKLGSVSDGNLFEECVVEILSKSRPGLIAVKGGADEGRDGEYSTDGDGKGLLVTTTNQSVITNLTKNLTAHRRSGRPARRVLLATSAELTPQQKTNLEKRATKLGYSLEWIYDRDYFAREIYRDPVWAKALLGLSSNAQALTLFPVTNRPYMDITLHGRDLEYQALRQCARDTVVSGQPGSGKTYLLAKFAFENDGYFVVSDNPDQIAAEVRAKAPHYLILDDAHTKKDLLDQLKQLRETVHADYHIIVSVWPSHALEFKLRLLVPQERMVELRKLDPDAILEIVKAANIEHRDLQRRIVQQSEGLPGIAVTLCYLCFIGDVQSVYVGDALADDLIPKLEDELGDSYRSLVPVLAIAGATGLEMEDCARRMAVSPINLRRELEKLRYAGFIREVRGGRIALYPKELRAHTVKRYFLTASATNIEPYTFIADYEDRAACARVIIEGLFRGGVTIEAKLVALLEELSDTELWSMYAALGPTQANYVIASYPKAALACLSDCLLASTIPAIDLALSCGAKDDSDLDRNSGSPLRKLRDWMTSARQVGEGTSRRLLVVDRLRTYTTHHEDWELFAKVVSYAYSPYFEFHETDAGAGRTLSYAKGLLPAEELHRLTTSFAGLDLSHLTASQLRRLVGLAQAWVFNDSLGRARESDEQAAARKAGAATIIRKIAEVATTHPGILTQLIPLARQLGVSVSPEIPELFSVLYPIDDYTVTPRAEAAREAEQTVRALAKRHAGEAPERLAHELLHVEAQAREAGIAWPRYTPTFLSELAVVSTTQHLATWVEYFRQTASPEFVEPFYNQLIEREPTHPITQTLLDDERHVGVAVQAILSGKVQGKELEEAALRKAGRYPLVVKVLAIRSQIKPGLLPKLLTHPEESVRMVTATAYIYGDELQALSAAERQLWKQAIIDYDLEDASMSHEVGDAIAAQPDMAGDWLEHHLHRSAAQSTYKPAHFSSVAPKIVTLILADRRLRIIGSLKPSPYAANVITQLVGSDLESYETLLANAGAKELHLAPLKQVDKESWPAFAAAALAAGYPDQQIVSASFTYGDTWWGDTSAHLGQMKERFVQAMESDNEPVAAIAKSLVRTYDEAIASSLAGERDENLELYN